MNLLEYNKIVIYMCNVTVLNQLEFLCDIKLTFLKLLSIIYPLDWYFRILMDFDLKHA